MKKVLSCFLALVLLFTPMTVKATSVEEFIQEHKDDVVKIAKEKDLFASVMMAQAILESGSGNSTLASQYNNYFGMKGAGVSLSTKEYDSKVDTVASFQVFDSPIDSFRAYANNFYSFSTPIYSDFLNADNPIDAAYALNGVYSTTSNYADDLIALMKTYDLFSLDEEVEKVKKEEAEQADKEKNDKMLIQSYKLISEMINKKIRSTARKLYKSELLELSKNKNTNILDKMLLRYYDANDIAKVFNVSVDFANIMLSQYRSEIKDNNSMNISNSNKVRSLEFNKYFSQYGEK